MKIFLKRYWKENWIVLVLSHLYSLRCRNKDLNFRWRRLLWCNQILLSLMCSHPCSPLYTPHSLLLKNSFLWFNSKQAFYHNHKDCHISRPHMLYNLKKEDVNPRTDFIQFYFEESKHVFRFLQILISKSAKGCTVEPSRIKLKSLYCWIRNQVNPEH